MNVFSSRIKRFISKMMVLLLVVSSCIGSGTVSYAAESGSVSTTPGDVLQSFMDPDNTDKPMARLWFPDAGAGLDTEDTIATQIQALADGGWGGVEVTMLANGVTMTNEEAKIFGWGTEAWQSLLKKVLTVANGVEDGFTVDITITPHWPTVISSVDPNDAASSQEISYETSKLIIADSEEEEVVTDASIIITTGPSIELPLPETKLSDYTVAVEGANFIFTDTLVSAALVQVASISESGDVTYDFDSIIDLTDSTSAIEGAGFSAGVPDEAACTEYGFDYNQVLSTWGDEPAEDADFSQSYNGKVDTEGNRKRMADWQYEYEANLGGISALDDYTASEGTDLQAGDYVVVATYRRGTGQVMSDGPFGGSSILMYGRTYTTNYFAQDGVDAITDYWNSNIMDAELIALLEENAAITGASIFEDSIEGHTTSSYWSYNLLDELDARAYDYTEQIPLVMALGASSFDDSDLTGRINEDYNALMGELYDQEHATPIKVWASEFGYSYRAQPYALTGLDIGAASAVLDIPEGDNGAKGDGLRYMAGAASMGDKRYLSMEAVTGFGNLKLNWADVITEIAQNFSDGVNHVVLHGTPYNKTFNGFISEWPGWLAFGNCFSDSYTYRQAYWEDVDSMTGYIARNQSILAGATAKIDFAVFRDVNSASSTGTGNEFQELLDLGYSYNFMSEGTLALRNARVNDNVLYADGPAYKALVLDNVSQISEETMSDILGYAKSGLPVISYNSDPTAVYGSESDDNSDDYMLELYEELLSLDNVTEIDTEAALIQQFDDLDIEPHASYDADGLETTYYLDESDGTGFYYLFNNPLPDNSGMVMIGQNSSYKGGETITASVALEGDGIPYLLDAWTGDITPIVDYTIDTDGRIVTEVELTGGESAMIAVVDDQITIEDINPDTLFHTTYKTGGELLYEDGEIVFRSNTADTYEVGFSNGIRKEVVIDEALEDFDLGALTWDLEIESFSPDQSGENIQSTTEGIAGAALVEGAVMYKDPTATIRTTVNFDDIELMNWSDLPATAEQLSELGVESMDNVVGIGYYTTTFNIPEGWSSSTGAVMSLGYSQDQVTEVTVNGTTIEAIDCVSDQVNIGSYLVTGTNVITIKLCTSIFNRSLVENSVYSVPGPQLTGTDTVALGLKSVMLSPYTQVSYGDMTTVTTDSGDVLNAFLNPMYTDKPMARMWFPDAGAGLDENDTIATQIEELAAEGFGGVEVTMLGNGSEMTNEDIKYVGWGTDAWRALLKKVLIAANSIEDGFTVDITITPHWPTVISDIDPNDQAASQEISYATQTFTSADIDEDGNVVLPMPEVKTSEYTNELEAANFIFTDTFVSAVLMQVESVDESGNVTYDMNSMIDISSDVSAIDDEGYAAGVPDEAACEAYGWDYQDTLDLYGEAPAEGADLSQSFNGKVDAEGNRARMADWQDFYQANVSDLAGYATEADDSVDASDYVLVATYRRGTGQVMSDGPFGGASVLMYGRTYTTNYFAEDGVDAITYYWENNILDEELRALLEENGSSIFEDSIESHTSSSYWSYNLLDVMEEDGYDYTVEMPIVVALGSSSFDDSDLAGRIEQDFNLLLSSQFQEEHAAPIVEWAETFNYTYRAQPYSLPGLDIGAASASVDIPEGDNSAKGDGLRYMSGAVNMSDKTYLSMEAVTATGNLKMNWADVITEVAQNFSHGVNHVILHGTPYNKTFDGDRSDWPGWLAFGNNFAGSYTYRQVYWDDAQSMSNYITRNQSVLSTGKAKVDFALLQDITTSFSTGTGNEFQEILDMGYSYNILSEGLMGLSNATVSNNRLYEDGPSYKALVLDEVTTVSEDTMKQVLNFAEAGLPIILLKTEPTSVYGTESASNDDQDMLTAFNTLAAMDNVSIVDDEEELIEALEGAGVDAYASYEAANLETSCYVDDNDGSVFYYMYNNPMADNTGMSAGKGDDYKAADVIEATVTLEGSGIPYLLDAWTGEVTPIADYTIDSDGNIVTDIELSGGDSMLIAIIDAGIAASDYDPADLLHRVEEEEEEEESTDMFGGGMPWGGAETTDDTEEEVALEGSILYDGGSLVYRSNTVESGDIELSDGSVNAVEITESYEALDLSDASWDLEIQSYGPYSGDDNTETLTIDGLGTYELLIDPSRMTVTTVEFDDVTLGLWEDLEATDEQLSALGVESMDNVSGVGYYTTTFDIDNLWALNTGAVLALDYSQDQVTEVTINGTTIDTINCVSDKLDIGNYLVYGENTLTIKLCSQLFNRAVVESMVYTLGGMQMTGTTTVDTGLVGAVLNPYTELNLSEPDTMATSLTVASESGEAYLYSKDDTLQMLATVEPSDASQSVRWSVVNGTGEATINADGVLDGSDDGTVTVVATANDGSGIYGELVVTLHNQSSSRRTSSTSTVDTTAEETTGTEETTEEPAPAESNGAEKFDDLGNYGWATDAIDNLVKLGIVKGTSETTFDPGRNVIRGDFATLLVRAMALEAEGSDNFSDVSPEDYYAEAIHVFKGLGLASGTGNGEFAPKNDISRQDLMVLTYNALVKTGVISSQATGSDLSVFGDAGKVAGYAEKPVSVLVSLGIVKGDGYSLNPTGTATRAEAAMIIESILELIGE